MSAMPDLRLFSAAAERNRDPILAVLQPVLAGCRRVLEVASGTGEHVVHFARAMPDVEFQPTDQDAAARASVESWVAEAGLANVLAALPLDAAAPPWAVGQVDAVLCINMVHISPWACTTGLMRGAAWVLPAGGVLFLYGPFRRDGQHTAPSNAVFDESLRSRDPAWGVRDLEAVAEEAGRAGFGPPEVRQMPANNLAVVFRLAAGDVV